MTATRVIVGGMPTKFEENKLREMWPVKELKAGDLFDYQDVANIIESSKDSFRFRTVTNAWRKHIETETGIRIAPDGTGTQFKVLSEQEKLEAVKEKRQSLNRQGRKNFVRTGYIDRNKLDDVQKTEFDFIQNNERKFVQMTQLRKGLPQ